MADEKPMNDMLKYFKEIQGNEAMFNLRASMYKTIQEFRDKHYGANMILNIYTEASKDRNDYDERQANMTAALIRDIFEEQEKKEIDAFNISFKIMAQKNKQKTEPEPFVCMCFICRAKRRLKKLFFINE